MTGLIDDEAAFWLASCADLDEAGLVSAAADADAAAADADAAAADAGAAAAFGLGSSA